ncbi:MAG: hypothetical protein ACK57G_20190 [Planctomycetota bacterium]
MNNLRNAIGIVICLFLCHGCSQQTDSPSQTSADGLWKQKISQMNRVVDIAQSGGTEQEIESEREKLNALVKQLDEEKAKMSESDWRNLCEKYNDEDSAATGRMVFGAVGIKTNKP